MAPTLTFTCIADRKARKAACQQRMQGLMKKAEEIIILCNMSVCLIFFSHDDDKLVAWPSQEVAKSLIDRYNELPDTKRNMEAEDQESYNKTNIQMIEKKLAQSKEVIEELEMDQLIFQLQNGRMVTDLSQTDIDNLISYANKKILARGLGCTEHPYTSVNESFLGDDIPTASDVAPECGPCFLPMGSGSVSLMDKWFFADPKVQKHGENHLTIMRSRFDLNMEPFDDDDEMETCEGESSKSVGADDA